MEPLQWGTPGNRNVRGDSVETMHPHIQEFAHYFYEVIFQEMAKGEPKVLKQRFGSLVRGCDALYRARVGQAKAEK